MTLKEYIDQLQQFVIDNPKLLDAIVIYSSDSEGNSYSPVVYSPSIGYFENSEFDMCLPESENNAVCIN